MTTTVLGTGVKNANNTTAVPVALTGTLVVGNGYFATVGGNVVSTLDASWTATDSLGNTWTKADSQVNGSSVQVSQFYCLCTTGGTNPTVTFTPGNSVGRVVIVVEDPNVTLAASPLDTHVKGSGSNASVTAGSTGTLAQANEYAYMSTAFASGSTASSVDSSFVLEGTTVSTNGTTDKRCQSADRTVAATTALSPTITLNTANAWAAITSTYKVSTSTNASVSAVAATATATAVAPVVGGDATVTGVRATVTASASAPAATGGALVGAVTAVATATPKAPSTSGGGVPATTGPYGETLTHALNRVAGTTGKTAQGAAQVWANAPGMSLLGCLNKKAGTRGLGMNAVLNVLAGTYELDAQGAADHLLA